MRISDLINEEQLDELSFMGSQCTKDCSGHRAGYKWSLDRGGVENPASPSQSFVNGSNIGHRQVQNNKQQRTQGGGRIRGYQSQTASAVKKRQARAQAKVDQGMNGSPMDETRIIHPGRVDVFFSPDPHSKERRVIAKNIPAKIVDRLIDKVAEKFGVYPEDFYTVPVGDEPYHIV